MAVQAKRANRLKPGVFAMSSEKGWYWVAAGVLALGLSQSYAGSTADWARQAKDCSRFAIHQIRARLASDVESISGLGCRRSTVLPDAGALAAQISDQVARVQVQAARQQEAMARLQAEEIRVAATEQARHAIVCSRQVIRIHPPQIVPGPDDGTI
jgi:hypothetical protein